MTEATQVLGSTIGIWAIVIVTVAVLAFWMIAIQVANRKQTRDGRHAGMTTGATTDSAPYGNWAGGSVAGERSAEIPNTAVHEPIGTQRQDTSDASSPDGEQTTGQQADDIGEVARSYAQRANDQDPGW